MLFRSLLALRYRRADADDAPAVRGPVPRRRRASPPHIDHRSARQLTLPAQIDPNRTVSAGRVDIGAFRTYPQGYTPPNAAASEYQSIPLSKIEDFGVHANSYYPLEISHFKSSSDAKLLDLLWNKYWVMTLSQSPLVSVRRLPLAPFRNCC